MGGSHHTQPQTDDNAQHTHAGAPSAQMHALLQRNASAHDVAELSKQFPMHRGPLLEELHRSRGNAFVNAVMGEVDPGAGSTLAPPGQDPNALPRGSVFADDTTKAVTALENLEAGCNNHMTSFTPILQGYTRARDALDKGAIGELGSTTMASLELMFVCLDGIRIPKSPSTS